MSDNKQQARQKTGSHALQSKIKAFHPSKKKKGKSSRSDQKQRRLNDLFIPV